MSLNGNENESSAIAPPSFHFRMQKEQFVDFILVPLSLLVISLLGNYGVFFGHTFFTEEDPLHVFYIQAQNSHSQGWRPDVGLGISYFFGDPAVFHPWGMFRWWHHLFEDDYFAYSFSIVILVWIVSVVQYALLRKTVPKLGRTISVLLSSLPVFGSLRFEFFFNRFWIVLSIVSVSISLILYDFVRRPSFRHYFLYSLTLCFALLIGSVVSIYQGLFFSLVFFFLLVGYKKMHRNPAELWGVLKRFFLLNVASGLTILFLGAWTFYSIFYEQLLVGYVRDPDYSNEAFFASMSLPVLINKLLGYFHAGVFSNWQSAMGLEQTFRMSSANIVSPFIPLVLLFSLFYKSQNFWEFASKCVVFGFLIYQEIAEFFPGFLNIIQSIFHLYPPLKFQPVIHMFEVVLVGIFLHRIQSSNWTISSPGQNLIKVTAFFISLIYAGFFFLAFLSVFAPQALESYIQFSFNWFSQFLSIPEKAKAVLPGLISGNIRLFNETMGVKNIVFYGLTFALVVLFTTSYWKDVLRLAKGRVFAVILLANSILLAWSVYPMNKETLVWDRQQKNGSNLSEIFKPTDRIAKLGILGCRSRPDFSTCVEERIIKGEFGPRRYITGYRLAPTLDFSRAKSFTSKEAALMMDEFMRREGKYEKGYRRLFQGFHTYFPSKLYDFSAVNYFFSTNRQPEHEHLELVHASKQFYLYKNLNAWPYFYLADRIEHIQNFGDLYDAEKGIAYLWKDSDSFGAAGKNGNSKGRVELEKFEFGEMVFQTDSQEEEVLVVMDAWHPNWKAQIDGNEIDVIKANGVFKGVRLPAGKHKLHFFFDSSPYLPGVWISIVAWIIFLGSWCWISKLNPEPSNGARQSVS